GEPGDGDLRHGVVEGGDREVGVLGLDHADVAEVGRGGRLVDDLAAVLALHVPLHRAAHQPGARQVHGEDAIEVGEGVLGPVEVEVDGGVVDEDVDAAETLDGSPRDLAR